MKNTIDTPLIAASLRRYCCIANPLSLLCLKVSISALTEEKKINRTFRSADIKKHRDDVFKLLAMRIDPFTPVELSLLWRWGSVFINTMEESFANQSLQDSLLVTDDDIRGFLGIMKKKYLESNKMKIQYASDLHLEFSDNCKLSETESIKYGRYSRSSRWYRLSWIVTTMANIRFGIGPRKLQASDCSCGNHELYKYYDLA